VLLPKKYIVVPDVKGEFWKTEFQEVLSLNIYWGYFHLEDIFVTNASENHTYGIKAVNNSH